MKTLSLVHFAPFLPIFEQTITFLEKIFFSISKFISLGNSTVKKQSKNRSAKHYMFHFYNIKSNISESITEC